MNEQGYRRVARFLCNKASVNNLKITLGEHGHEKYFLHYNKMRDEFNIEWEDGKKFSTLLSNKIMPLALGVLLSIYEGAKKEKAKLPVINADVA